MVRELLPGLFSTRNNRYSSRQPRARLLLPLALALLLAPSIATAHGGGLDDIGGHTNRSTGEYHCHRNPCRTIHKSSQDAIDEAVTERRSFSGLYDRSDWPHWVDKDRDCQDTRAEILIATSKTPVKFKRNRGCVVSWGEWFDPFTGRTVTQASSLDIDHIVPLAEAHRSGGHAWTRAERRQFANDPDNLLPVTSSVNRSKGDQDPAHWLPGNNAYHCEYITKWRAIKLKYHLDSDEREKKAVARISESCGTQH